MSQFSLRIVMFSDDPDTAQRVSNRLHEYGIHAEAYVVSNTPTSDAEIASVLTSKNLDGVIIDCGIQEDPEWYERVVKIIKTANPHVFLIHNEGPDDIENAIESHFKIQLPLTSTY
jgi:CO dehydrogenase/acetyl-CoA synthase epsilon subunit